MARFVMFIARIADVGLPVVTFALVLVAVACTTSSMGPGPDPFRWK